MSPIRDSIARRADALFEAHGDAIARRTDRMFIVLMVLQFVAGLLAAVIISPRTWSGAMSSVHLHVWAALIVGALIALFPVLLAVFRPGRFSTRCVIASAQMLFSGLLIHLSGGRIETHFHVFGSLAFLAFYRDWRVFIPATAVVGVDHLLRGLYWPESVYGVLSATPWRSVEHAAWVVFEDIFLIYSCFQNVREMKEIAEKQARLEDTNAIVEEEVRHRTDELSRQTSALQLEVTERKRIEGEREDLHRRLVRISREAGMAEVATSVLHNVGNVLNSVNVSATLVADRLRQSGVRDLVEVAEMLHQAPDAGAFITQDERGKLVPQFLHELGMHLVEEQKQIVGELDSLNQNVEHIKEIVASQQSYARATGVLEVVDVRQILESALDVARASLLRHHVSIVREYAETASVTAEKHKLLQILVNLITNAKQALMHVVPDQRQLTLRIGMRPDDLGFVRIEVRDNGVGIAPENLTRIFSLGFTTKKEGHGFGLHSAAVTVRAFGGRLSVHSGGPGRGASFVLDIPLHPTSVGAS